MSPYGPFNDQNQHEPDRYVKDPSKCDYVIDFRGADECRPQPSERYKVIATEPFLDAERTPVPHRWLYVPFWHERAVQAGKVPYREYVLYQKQAYEDE